MFSLYQNSILLTLFFIFTIIYADITISPRSVVLYNTISPKLKIIGNGFLSTPDNTFLVFEPPLIKDKHYTLEVSPTSLVLSLMPNERWVSSVSISGTTVTLLEVFFDSSEKHNELPSPVNVAIVIPTPTVKPSSTLIYQTATPSLIINGTNFNPKQNELIFDTPLRVDEAYKIQVLNSNTLLLTLRHNYAWRLEPGPLRLIRIDTGAGPLRLDPDYGGIIVAEVQADLAGHGVTVISDTTKIYQSTIELVINGDGFNTTNTKFLFANGLLGKGVNYTTFHLTENKAILSLTPGSHWRRNVNNLPGPLVLLSVEAGAGFVPIGPTAQQKGTTVAMVYEDPTVFPSSIKLFQTHSYEFTIRGTGFVSSLEDETLLEFYPPLVKDIDYTMSVIDRTKILLTLEQDARWSLTLGPLHVISINTGPGKVFFLNDGITVANIVADETHDSGIEIFTSSQKIYDTDWETPIEILGNGFENPLILNFEPPLEINVDYSIVVDSFSRIYVTLVHGRKWRSEPGSLLVKSIISGGKLIELAKGNGIRVASVFKTPTIKPFEGYIFATHTKMFSIEGTGFTSLDLMKIKLYPTLDNHFFIKSVTPSFISLQLRKDYEWSDLDEPLYIIKIDTGAGWIDLDEGIKIGLIRKDDEDITCNDLCETALDGICDDGNMANPFYSDDLGGFFQDDKSYFGSQSDFNDLVDDFYMSKSFCSPGTDCTDCGGPLSGDGLNKITCSNTCPWARDGTCDDPRGYNICPAGTDCQDCGPVGASNFTDIYENFDYTDDDTFWGDDFLDIQKQASPTKAQVHGHKPPQQEGTGVVFIHILEGIVFFIGSVVATGGGYMILKWYRGDKIEYMPVSTSNPDEIEMPERRREKIVPQVIH